MSNKELLGKIKEARKRILDEKSFQKKCILLNSFEELGYLDWLIKQAEKVERYRHALEHFANLGTNHDTNPTLVMDGNEVFVLLDYIKSMDKYVRCEARKALEEVSEPIE